MILKNSRGSPGPLPVLHGKRMGFSQVASIEVGSKGDIRVTFRSGYRRVFGGKAGHEILAGWKKEQRLKNASVSGRWSRLNISRMDE